MLNFEDRKRDHIEISLSTQSQSPVADGFESIKLIHEALPDFNFSEISLQTKTLGLEVASPVFVSSMTLGHQDAAAINYVLARVCSQKNILMGVGSQRRQLDDDQAAQECVSLRNQFPNLKVMGNLGISQLIQTPVSKVQSLVDSLEAQAMIIHTNPLQECIQREGTPDFKGSWQALENLCRELPVPVILKETGCGFSTKTLQRLKDVGLTAVDVSGRGGTHWGRVESQRLSPEDLKSSAGKTFSDWGISTLESLLSAVETPMSCEVWASGGVRSGLDVAKLLAVGAQMVGVAQPVLAAALQGEEKLSDYLDRLHYELKVAMFCCGISQVESFKRGELWKKT